MTASDSDEDQNVDEQKANSNKPKKLSSQLTKFDILEQERMENERLQAQKEKIKELEEELRLFQEQKQAMDQVSLHLFSEVFFIYDNKSKVNAIFDALL